MSNNGQDNGNGTASSKSGSASVPLARQYEADRDAKSTEVYVSPPALDLHPCQLS